MTLSFRFLELMDLDFLLSALTISPYVLRLMDFVLYFYD